MRSLWSAVVVVSSVGSIAAAADTPKEFQTGFQYPESVCYGPDGNLYVTEIGSPDKTGDGKLTVVENGKTRTVVDGLDNPKGLVFFKDAFYLTDVTKVIRVDLNGKKSVFIEESQFPTKPLYLNDIAVEPQSGTFLVSDSGDRQGKQGAAYRIAFQRQTRRYQVDTIADTKSIPELHTPNGVAFDGADFAILADFGKGALYRIRLADRSTHKFVEDIAMEGADGLIWDHFGRFFITSWKTGKVFAIPRPGQKPILIGEGLQSAADGCLDKSGKNLLIPDMKAGTLTSLSTTIPGWEVDESELPVALEVAYPNLKWTGWDSGEESGRPNPLRPIVLTHAGDASKRTFVALQQGIIHVFDNTDDAKETKVFLDISDRVRYSDRQNEEGLLGLTFHPKHSENGEFFVFYTDVKAKMANVVSRFRLKGDDPNTADPASEEEIIRFEKPFWNHDGGTIVFGPDGYLYITHGDGGAGGDPHENGQKKNVWLGKVLRIDVDKKANGKNYAIPADNPFVNDKDAAPEVWAYGIRNIWRMAFDRETGDFWAGEVGQNLFEEIILLKAGGNYGWSIRESLHPFGRKGVDVRPDLIEPIWEYHHDIGKSITGGFVYRGKAIPELQGCYLYVDYVSNRFWALKYDAKQGRVIANHELPTPGVAVMSFGEDDQGEAYIMGATQNGKGIFRLVKSN